MNTNSSYTSYTTTTGTTVPTNVPTSNVQHSSTVGDPSHPPSMIKGNINSMMGKFTHNPQKQMDGNIMIANSREQKAAKCETKALEWERKGNANKSQKNREKAAYYRQKAAAKLNQPLTTGKTSSSGGSIIQRPAFMGGGNKNDRAARCEAKALEYERNGNMAKAQKNREKAWRIREKAGISHPVNSVPPAGYTSSYSSTSTYTSGGPTYTTTVPPTH